jgi:hypothetical protein
MARRATWFIAPSYCLELTWQLSHRNFAASPGSDRPSCRAQELARVERLIEQIDKRIDDIG